jgi:dTMP kinase
VLTPSLVRDAKKLLVQLRADAVRAKRHNAARLIQNVYRNVKAVRTAKQVVAKLREAKREHNKKVARQARLAALLARRVASAVRIQRCVRAFLSVLHAKKQLALLREEKAEKDRIEAERRAEKERRRLAAERLAKAVAAAALLTRWIRRSLPVLRAKKELLRLKRERAEEQERARLEAIAERKRQEEAAAAALKAKLHAEDMALGQRLRLETPAARVLRKKRENATLVTLRTLMKRDPKGGYEEDLKQAQNELQIQRRNSARSHLKPLN